MIRSRESAIVSLIPAHAWAVQVEAQRAAEITKGCERTIWPQPVALEPPYTAVTTRPRPDEVRQILVAYEEGIRSEDLVRLRIWISRERVFEWARCESFLKQLCGVSHRLLFEIAGNHDGICFRLGCHRNDLPIVQTAFEAKVEYCMITPQAQSPFDLISMGATSEVRFRDYLPEPPYHHLLTRSEELKDSPYEGLVAALIKLPPPAIGLYQVVFQPVPPTHNWHHNVKFLTDLEYFGNQANNPSFAQRYLTQGPSWALNPAADKLECKAHNDKPFFATAVRIAVAGGVDLGEELLALTTPMSLYQHGGGQLSTLTEADYRKVLGPCEIRKMLSQGLTHRPGFLVNSDELTGLVHVPPAGLLERWDSALDQVDPFTEADLDFSEGVPIGVATVAGRELSICLTSDMRKYHVHMVGDSGMGKSFLEEAMILYDIQQGHGVVVLDPHGDLVTRLLAQIPKEAVARTIYFDPGDPDWVPLWNPLGKVPGREIGRIADDLVAVFKSFVKDWGDRLEHILRHCIFGLMHLPQASFLDLLDLLRTGTPESRELKELILQRVQDEAAQQFWRHDYEKYRTDEFAPVRHKLSKLLVGGTHALMLSQLRNTFSFREIMDDGLIFLANLSALGTQVRNVLGGFQVATIHETALSRSDTPPDERRPCYVYLDEAHRFTTDCLEDMLVETRKFAVHWLLAHQYMRQFTRSQMDALAGVGTTVVFNVGQQDAEHLAKDFLKTVRTDDIRALEPQEALVRIGTEMAKIRTRDRPPICEVNFRDEIIEQSHRKYYRRVEEVQEWIRHRHRGSRETFSDLVPDIWKATPDGQPPARSYDEL